MDLSLTHVSDLSPLAELTRLRDLNIVATHVSDLSPLIGLTRLEGLFLARTDVSDVTPLAGLTNLEVLELSDTHVSEEETIRSSKRCYRTAKLDGVGGTNHRTMRWNRSRSWRGWSSPTARKPGR